jgi:hypothetical protein
MTLPIAEHGDVVTCTSGHRVGVAERLDPQARRVHWPVRVPDDFALMPDPGLEGARGCPLCGEPWWRKGAVSPDFHVQNKGWVSTTLPCPTAAAVARKIADRADVGLVKYGTTLAGAGLSRRELLVHAQEEAMDMAVYLQRLIEMEDE